MEREEILELITKEYSNWEIDPKPLGNGSFGVVFQMVDRENGEKRALKVIPIPHDDAEIDKKLVCGYPVSEIEKDYMAVKNRVLDEVMNIIQLRTNDNVINIFGYREIRRKEQIGWIVCFDMEYLPPLVETQRMDEQRIVRMALDMCNALKSCHARKIVHRDIKPENILQKGDSFVLADFGVSKIASAQSNLSLRGTYDYMAPELVRQQKFPGVSPDTVDIYSLGITLYVYANSNRLPFIDSFSDMRSNEKRTEMDLQRWNSPVIPAPCGVSARLAKIILCACEKDPRHRYQSAAEMEYDLLHLNTNDFLYCDRMKQLAQYSSNRAASIPPQAVSPMNSPVRYAARPQSFQGQQTMPTPRVQQTAPRVQQPAPRVQQPTPRVQQPTPRVQQPAPRVQQPTPRVQQPAPRVQQPAPRVQQQVPAQRNQQMQGSMASNRSKTEQGAPESRHSASGKSKKKRIIIGLIAGAVALVGGAAGVYFIGFKMPEAKKNNKVAIVSDGVSNHAIPIDAANTKLDEDLYGPTVEHYYEALLGRKPSSDEKEEAFADIRGSHGDTECIIRELLDSDEFSGKNYTDKEFGHRVREALWQPVSDELDLRSEQDIQASSRDAFVESLFEETWPDDHSIVQIYRESIIGQYDYYVENNHDPNEKYEITTYLFDAETGERMTIDGRTHLGKISMPVNQRTKGPEVPELPEGEYRLVIRKDPYGTVVYDEGFEVK